MLLCLLSLLVNVVGAAAFVLALRLRRVTTMVTGFWVVLTGQIAGETLLVGGLLRQLHPGVLAVTAVAFGACEVAGCYRYAKDAAREAARHAAKVAGWTAGQMVRHPLVMILALLVVGQYAWQVTLTVSLPQASYDSLAYHLIGPVTWIQHGAIVHSKQNLFSDVYPQDQELLTAWVGTFLHSLRYAGLTTLPFVAMAGSAVTMLARNLRVRAHLALLGGLGIVAMPAVFLQASTAYVDIAAGATAVAALGLLLVVTSGVTFQRGTARSLAGHLLLVGIAAGLAAGIKSTNLVVVALVTIIAFVQFVRVTDIRPDQLERTIRPKGRIGVACLAIPIAALSAFWYIRTWITWANPFYPVSLLGFSGQGTTREVIIGANEPPQLRHVLFGELGATVKSWLFDLHPHHFVYDQRLGGFGLQWPIVVVPALAIGTLWFALRRPSYLFGLVMPAVLLALATSAAWWARYTIALAGVGCVCLALCLERLALMASDPQGRLLGRRVPAGVVSVLTAVFVAASALSMWWATDPTSYEILVNNSLRLETPGQLVHVMSLSDPEAVLYPWYAYTDLDEVLPAGATLAMVDSGEVFTYPLVGADFRRRLMTIGNPQTPGQLAASLVKSGVRYVLLGPTLLRDAVNVDPSRFLPLTSGGAIDGSDVYELGHWPVCTDPTLVIASSNEDAAGVLHITGRLTDSCGVAPDIAVDLYQGDDRVPIYDGSDKIIDTRSTTSDGTVTFTVTQPPPFSRFFLRTSSQPTGRPSPGVSASGVITPGPVSP